MAITGPTTPNFNFGTLGSNDDAGYVTINDLIQSIDTILHTHPRLLPSGLATTNNYVLKYTTGNALTSGLITADSLAVDAVTTTKILNDAVTSDKIAANAVGSSEIAAGAVDSSELASTLDLTGKTITIAAPTTNTNPTTKLYVDQAVSGATPGVNSINYINLNTTAKKYDVTVVAPVAGRCFDTNGSLTSASLTSDINATSQPLVTTIGLNNITLTFGALGNTGDTISILQFGSGVVTITATSGMLLNGVSNGSIIMGGQYSLVTLIFLDTGKVVAVGDYL